MFSVLPDLTPRDCHHLWYVSSRNPKRLPPYLDPAIDSTHAGPAGAAINHGVNAAQIRSRTVQAAIIERSALGRLRADEAYMERRKANISNLGSTWLKPPGLGKTLYQMREERREAEEHAEALRREQANQELADAAAAGIGLDEDIEDMEVAPGLGEDGEMMVDEEGAGAEVRDLDDEIPDADADGGDFGYDGVSDEDEDESEDDEEDDDDDGGAGPGGPGTPQGRLQRRELARNMASVRATEDRMRERMARDRDNGEGDLYGEEEEDIDGEYHGELLEEEDLVGAPHLEGDMDEDMGMDADLDAEIPEGEEDGGYEHTDSDASLSSDEDNGPGPASAARGSQAARHRSSMAQSEATHNLDISSILDSSPQAPRRG